MIVGFNLILNMIEGFDLILGLDFLIEWLDLILDLFISFRNGKDKRTSWFSSE